MKTVIETYRAAIDDYVEGSYNQNKVKGWMTDLATVYNRDFWSGYYLGQVLGEFNNTSGSKATQKRVYIGKGVHFYPKAGVAEFKIEAQQISVGDDIIITGSTTGVVEHTITEMMIDEVFAEKAEKGVNITFPINERVRSSDKLYKIVKTNLD